MQNLYTSIQKLQQRFDHNDIASIVIGGVAVAVWGEPRVTRDADLKVLLARRDADRLLNILGTEYLSLLPSPQDAIRKQAMLFVQDTQNVRLDLLLADTPYDIEAINRRRRVEVWPGVTLQLCSPEDLLIYKLISTRPRDHEDARGVVQRQADSLDDAYIIGWLKQFEAAFDDSTPVSTYHQLRRR